VDFLLWSFNPRAREGRDFSDSKAFRDAVVSIHAPGKGATLTFGASAGFDDVSIHAPGKGATSSDVMYISV